MCSSDLRNRSITRICRLRVQLGALFRSRCQLLRDGPDAARTGLTQVAVSWSGTGDGATDTLSSGPFRDPLVESFVGVMVAGRRLLPPDTFRYTCVLMVSK